MKEKPKLKRQKVRKSRCSPDSFLQSGSGETKINLEDFEVVQPPESARIRWEKRIK